MNDKTSGLISSWIFSGQVPTPVSWRSLQQLVQDELSPFIGTERELHFEIWSASDTGGYIHFREDPNEQPSIAFGLLNERFSLEIPKGTHRWLLNHSYGARVLRAQPGLGIPSRLPSSPVFDIDLRDAISGNKSFAISATGKHAITMLCKIQDSTADQAESPICSLKHESPQLNSMMVELDVSLLPSLISRVIAITLNSGLRFSAKCRIGIEAI